MTTLMTDTDVKAACLAQVFKSRNVKGFGASEAKLANDTLVKLFQAQRLDGETFGRVAAYLGLSGRLIWHATCFILSLT